MSDNEAREKAWQNERAKCPLPFPRDAFIAGWDAAKAEPLTIDREALARSLQPLYDAAMDDLDEGAVRWLGSYIERETGQWPDHEECDDTSKHGEQFDGWAKS